MGEMTPPEMTPQRWRRIREILDATYVEDPKKRDALLEEACAGDSQLRREVEEYLRYSDEMKAEESSGFLSTPLVDLHREPNLGRRIGSYQILELLGRGGMGSVYRAERYEGFQQVVALKLIRRSMTFPEQEVAERFVLERQILAGLEHPNIAHLLDGGKTEDGESYFVMELVQGESLRNWCARRPRDLKRRIELFRKICGAVHYAHQHRVAHRDIKPANILVDSSNEPKLLDFGIAKWLDAPDETNHNPYTPRFASPEQLFGEPVTTASDIYSLGVLLFLLLTDRHPFPEDASLRDRLDDQNSPRPSGNTSGQRRKKLTGDLDSIVLKAMRPEPAGRYASALEISEDLRRHLAGEPVVACEGTALYLAGKLVRRHRWKAAFIVAVFAASLVAAGLGAVAIHEREQTETAQLQAKKVSDLLFDIFESINPNEDGKGLTVLDLLDRNWQRISKSLADEPTIRVQLIEPLGRAYRDLGEYERARELLTIATCIQRDRDSQHLAIYLQNLAGVHLRLGDFAMAEHLYRKALEEKRRHGATDLEIARTRIGLAGVLQERGSFESAVKIVEDVLKLRRRASIEERDNLGIAKNLRTLGILHYQLSALDTAESLLREAMNLRTETLAEEHLSVIKIKSEIGRVLTSLGRIDEAEKFLRSALKEQENRLAAGNIDLARTRKDLAALLLERGIATEAEQLIDLSLAALRMKNAGDWEIAEAESLRGACLARRGEHLAAEKLLSESLKHLAATRTPQAIVTQLALRRMIEFNKVHDLNKLEISYFNPVTTHTATGVTSKHLQLQCPIAE